MPSYIVNPNGLIGLFGDFLIIAILGALVVYIYVALATLAIAKKTKTKNSWLAFIPIANLYLLTQMAGVPWWTFLIALFAGFVPLIGGLVLIVFYIWWWWKIAENINKPGWWSLLLLIPLVNLIIWGMMAWKE